jgi:hypothetical protein
MENTLVLAGDGQPLAEASLRLPADEASAGAILRVRQTQRLLEYYFGRGQRQVVLQDGAGLRWWGQIVATRWHPQGRLWYLRRTKEA